VTRIIDTSGTLPWA